MVAVLSPIHCASSAASHRVQAQRQPLGITILAARADLRATRHWIPRRLRPLDVRMFRHRSSQRRAETGVNRLAYGGRAGS